MSNSLVGKKAVITGGSRGLGFAIARAYLQQGADVAIASRSLSTVNEAVNKLEKYGNNVLGISCDVSQWDQILRLGEQVLSSFGGFDIWINNAGLSPAYGPTWEIPLDRIEDTINTNILGTFYGSWLALNHFQNRGSGVLINLLGRGAERKSPLQNAYGSSKAWVHRFTTNLAEETKGTNIRVVAFNPGLVYTDLVENVQSVPDAKDRLEIFSRVLALLGNPPEVPAKRAVWLATEDGQRAGAVHSLNHFPALLSLFLTRGVKSLLGRQPSEYPISIETINPAEDPLNNENLQIKDISP